MKTFTTALMSACLVLSAGSALAMDDMKKGDTMTMQQCKDHMAMAKKDGMKKYNSMMKKDTMCADMMKKNGMMNGGTGAMQSDGMASGAMKK